MDSLILYLSFATFNAFSNYSLQKKNEIKIASNIYKIDHKIQKQCSKDIEIDKKIEPYFKHLVENVKQFDLYNLYTNLENLKVEEKKSLYLIGQLGSYNPYDNIIKYASSKCLGHELLHVASANCIDKNNMQIGFSIATEEGRIGNAINEGYTDHLNEKLYNNHAKAYNCIRKIAEYTEELIGKEKMQALYFNNDLVGLIAELEKYMSREEAIKFITLQDSLLSAKLANNIYYKKPSHDINKILDNSFKQKALIK